MVADLLKRLALVSACLLPCVAQADIYGYTSPSGELHLTTFPSHDGFELIVKKEPTLTQQANKKTLNKAVNQPSHLLLKPELLTQVEQSANNNQIQSELIHAVMQVESAYQVKARSHKGAQGLMQLMPQTAKRFGVKDSYDPAQNIEGGAKYLKQLLTLFNNDIRLTLAAYNAGENAVIKYGHKIPPYKETQAYVPKVLKIYNALIQNSRDLKAN